MRNRVSDVPSGEFTEYLPPNYSMRPTPNRSNQKGRAQTWTRPFDSTYLIGVAHRDQIINGKW
ncbi:hypothetical protein QUF63_16865 [Anaerolineales bacterium HSG25]|nr:hypothetical protein [Anaerolineales bacterium HSG25]